MSAIEYVIEKLTATHPRRPHVDARMTHYISATMRGLTLGASFHIQTAASIAFAKLALREGLEREFEAMEQDGGMLAEHLKA